ncbi:MAG TPA: glycosyltransferase family 4 protein [Chloroflexota bacterium]|nr:glycosyltransferase family 4 protein [Chloroflexota bacterium]
MKLLFVSYPVGPIGNGSGGGVDLTMHNAAKALARRGHPVDVIAPVGSRLDHTRLIEVPGSLQPSAQYQTRGAPVSMPADSILANMWEEARRRQAAYDVLVNFAYDWLPFWVTPFFATPVAHLVSMCTLLDAMDGVIGAVAEAFPGRVAMHTHAQAQTFPFAGDCPILGNGLDLDLYPYNPTPKNHLCWIGRIAPEKGLEDAAAVAQATGIPLEVYGQIQDADYWNRILREFAGAPIQYNGFLDTGSLARAIGHAQAMLMTPKWIEAFGNVVMEALACGVPVVAYRRGGPAEMVAEGRTGWLVAPDSVDGLIAAVGRLNQLDRAVCRQQAERDYSLEALGLRWERWLAGIVGSAGGFLAPVRA